MSVLLYITTFIITSLLRAFLIKFTQTLDMLTRPIYLWSLSPLFQITSRAFKTVIESILTCISICLLASVFS